MTFAKWMEAIDNIVWNTLGCSVHDLPDYLFRDDYDDGASPEETAEELIANLGTY